jgi:hypothetical protein
VVVGAGVGGIATGVKLKRAGVDTFTIYESSLGIGGTWWDNTYPGAEVDVGSHLYCFSFKSQTWSRTHARQPELQKYLEETVDELDLRPHIRLGVTVESATRGHPLPAGCEGLAMEFRGLEDYVGRDPHARSTSPPWRRAPPSRVEIPPRAGGARPTGKVCRCGHRLSATQIVPAIQRSCGFYVYREPG